MAIIVGNSGDNNLVGTSGNDQIWAQGGDDTVDGGGGHDTIGGSSGDDLLDGGSGSDDILVALEKILFSVVMVMTNSMAEVKGMLFPVVLGMIQFGAEMVMIY